MSKKSCTLHVSRHPSIPDVKGLVKILLGGIRRSSVYSRHRAGLIENIPSKSAYPEGFENWTGAGARQTGRPELRSGDSLPSSSGPNCGIVRPVATRESLSPSAPVRLEPLDFLIA